MISVDAAAARLGISRNRIYAMVDEGRLRVRRERPDDFSHIIRLAVFEEDVAALEERKDSRISNYRQAPRCGQIRPSGQPCTRRRRRDSPGCYRHQQNN